MFLRFHLSVIDQSSQFIVAVSFAIAYARIHDPNFDRCAEHIQRARSAAKNGKRNIEIAILSAHAIEAASVLLNVS